MSNLSYRSSQPDTWTQPRPPQSECARKLKHGNILPLEKPGLLARLFGAK